MWRREGKNEEVFGTKEQSLSLLIQQAWDSAKCSMSDKAGTAYEGTSGDMQDEFSPCYYIYFLNYEGTKYSCLENPMDGGA